jgi:hypothetical protein
MTQAMMIDARRYRCPVCGAEIGEPCQGEPNPHHYSQPGYRVKIRPHKERLNIFERENIVVIANNTANQVLRTIEKYVPKDKIGDLIEDLSEIAGNKSYRETIELLRQQYEKENQ